MHTPGPWTTDESEKTHRGYGRVVAVVFHETRLTGPNDIHIVAPDAKLPEHPKKYETVKKDGADNAKLIAAAPQLLAACEAFISLGDELIPSGGSIVYRGKIADALLRARAAIAAATK